MNDTKAKANNTPQCSRVQGDCNAQPKRQTRYSKTETNIRLIQEAEAVLDKFWNQADEVEKKVINTPELGFTEETRLQFESAFLVSGNYTLKRTADWVEPPKSAKAAPKRSYSETFIFSEQGTEAPKFSPERPRKKVRTRGTPGPARAALQEPETAAPAEQAQEQTVYEVDARAFKVLSTLSWQPTYSSTPGGVFWNDFLYAMQNIGITAECEARTGILHPQNPSGIRDP
ncbi:hypothetical protein N7462_010742 [Penicillium macrosclerotiorum]|uniref:uncharacterized protein n=1 Tax=Penicillium macrosclerotiorum TaxID=303699 RepID=UPI0025466E43|nr:uncharacterized protein N7462_010742 [Penicillium macrosclerotiorum]KAJ5669672.1 hypothetical protein N7462_010742 [Penicillium macrosclerotiorum]